MTLKERRVFDYAVGLLSSDAARTAARNRRTRFREASASRYTTELDTSLCATVDDAETKLLPLLVHLYSPQRIPDGALHNLARHWINAYLSDAACGRSSLKGLAGKYAAALLREAKDEHIRLRYSIPLANFSAERNFSSSGVVNGKRYTYRFMKTPLPNDPALLGFNMFPAVNDPVPPALPFPLMVAKWALVVDVFIPKTRKTYSSLNCEEQSTVHRGLVTALRLFQDGDVDAPVQFLSRDLLSLSGGRAMMWSCDQAHLGSEYTLQENRVRAFQRFWKRFEKYLPASRHLPPRIQIAIDYFESSYAKASFAAFLDLCIAVEALFGIQSEQTYRLPLRVAAFLGRRTDDIFELHRVTKDLWKSRNKIAHGSGALRKPKFRKDVDEALPSLRALARKAILHHIQLYGRNSQSYERTIDSEFEKKFILAKLRS